MSSPTKTRLVNMVQTFIARNGREPAAIRLSSEDAFALETEIRNERGPRQEAIDSKGFKAAYAKLAFVTPIASYNAEATAIVP